MSKNPAKRELRELELRRERAETEKTELELAAKRISHQSFLEDHSFSRGKFETHRGIFRLYDVVDDLSAYDVARTMEGWAHAHPGEPITLYIYSPGGNVFSGISLYDSIRALAQSGGHHVTTIVRGYAASMGGILLQAGDTRVVGPESLVMVHEISSMAFGKLHELRDEVKFMERLNKRMFEILAERSEKWTGPRLYAHAKAKDVWLNAQESVDWGLADVIR